MLLPNHAAELRGVAGDDIRPCFVGYADAEPGQKLQVLRHFSGFPNGWLNEHSDEYVLAVIEYGIRFSQNLAEECDRLDLRYFDCSFDLGGTVEFVVGFARATCPVALFRETSGNNGTSPRCHGTTGAGPRRTDIIKYRAFG